MYEKPEITVCNFAEDAIQRTTKGDPYFDGPDDFYLSVNAYETDE
jgi:hypothetical protein